MLEVAATNRGGLGPRSSPVAVSARFCLDFSMANFVSEVNKRPMFVASTRKKDFADNGAVWPMAVSKLVRIVATISLVVNIENAI